MWINIAKMVFGICTTVHLSFPFFLTYCVCMSSAKGDTTIKATTPVNPVRIGDMFCLHCHIRNKENDHEITIQRKVHGHVERLVWNEEILENVDERIFLAVRQLDDGSLVYFLSVTDVKMSDQGEYTCKVIVSETLERVAEESAEVTVQYFPQEPYPVCSTNVSSMRVYSGTYVLLNCSSMNGNPTVKIIWKSSDETIRQMSTEHTKYVSSKASIHLTKAHDGAIFVCEIHSKAFPDKVKRCHVGPFIVQTNFGEDDDVRDQTSPTAPFYTVDLVHHGLPDATTRTDLNDNAYKCGQICSELEESNILLWRSATAVACGFALVFLIMGIVVAVKIPRMSERTVQVKTRTLQSGEMRPIYEDLIRRRDGDQLYMAIDKANVDKINTSLGIEQDHYHTAQIRH